MMQEHIARGIIGFDPTETLTVNEVSARAAKRMLASHPDTCGDEWSGFTVGQVKKAREALMAAARRAENAAQKVQCHVCKGRGWIKGQRCPKCKGAGYAGD
jgi:RecJ-like exonuclease